ncbi:hypothetical protein DND36_33235, partial [Pseudomonas savastanoi pv. glycinea]
MLVPVHSRLQVPTLLLVTTTKMLLLMIHLLLEVLPAEPMLEVLPTHLHLFSPTACHQLIHSASWAAPEEPEELELQPRVTIDPLRSVTRRNWGSST